MDLAEYAEHDAVGLAELVANGSLSPLEVLDVANRAVSASNSWVNAVVTDMTDEAERFIKNDLPEEGPLRGVPFLLKDLRAAYRGVATTSGSRFFRDRVPSYDSELVRRYKKAGLVIFGKTNTPEFGGNVSTEPILFGPTRNPWDREHIAGGSSGGSAAAVMAQMVPAAHASDGGGSIRIPASCCGAFGLKPSRGRNPAGPVAGEAWSGMSVEHAITRSVRDSAAILDASSGPDVGDPYWAPPRARPYIEEVTTHPGRLRIAFSKTAKSGVEVHKDCLRAIEESAVLLEDLGHSVEEAEPEYDGSALGDAMRTIIGANMKAAIDERAREVGRDPGEGDIERVIRMRANRGDEVTGTDYAASLQTMHLVGRVFGRFMSAYDVFMTPTTARPPLRIGELDTDTEDVDTFLQTLYSFIPFTAVFNGTGQPAMSVPLSQSGTGLPIGVQFAARYGDEATLFRLAGQLESARPWFDRVPNFVGGSR